MELFSSGYTTYGLTMIHVLDKPTNLVCQLIVIKSTFDHV
jgi:hypothetical protein